MVSPTISVIMPCYNAERHIASGLSSALAQTYRDLEILVVDDGSTDGSRRVVEGVKDPRVRLLVGAHRGVSAARNQGLAEAKGEFIAFLDADDTWDPRCLETLLAALRSRPDAAVAYCGWQKVGLPGGRGEPYVPPDYEAEQRWQHLLRCCPWPIHAALTRRCLINELGGFDVRLPTSEDYSLWLRVAARGTMVHVPEVLAYYHFHGSQQATRDKARLARNQLVVQRQFLRDFENVADAVGRTTARKITVGGLLNQGFECYWSRDLDAARAIFRTVMATGYGSPKDWLYMLPALLPKPVHSWMLRILSTDY